MTMGTGAQDNGKSCNGSIHIVSYTSICRSRPCNLVRKGAVR